MGTANKEESPKTTKNDMREVITQSRVANSSQNLSELWNVGQVSSMKETADCVKESFRGFFL